MWEATPVGEFSWMQGESVRDSLHHVNLFAEPSLYHAWLRNGAYAAPAVLFGMLVIWSLFSQAGWLKRRWYLRIAIPLTAVALLLPTGLHEVVLFV